MRLPDDRRLYIITCGIRTKLPSEDATHFLEFGISEQNIEAFLSQRYHMSDSLK